METRKATRQTREAKNDIAADFQVRVTVTRKCKGKKQKAKVGSRQKSYWQKAMVSQSGESFNPANRGSDNERRMAGKEMQEASRLVIQLNP